MGIRGMDISGSILQHLCFAAKNQGKSTPGTADVQWFIALVKHQTWVIYHR
jgi:hypothetical protein